MRLLRPVDSKWPVSQGWGEHPKWYKTFGLDGHPGRDYACPIGTPVFAMHDGTVNIIDQGDQYYGLQVWVHAPGYKTICGHLSDTVLPQGRAVKAGELIGRSGSSGNSTGPHVHAALSIDNVRIPGYGIWCNITPYIEEGETMASKLTWHFQQTTPWAADVVATSGARYVKQIFYSGDEPDLFPQCRTIARCWIGGDQVEQEYVNRAAAGAAAYFTDLLPFYEGLTGKVWCWEGPNEPACRTTEQRRTLSAFTAAWAARMAAAGYRAVVGNFATGNPDITSDDALRDLAGVWLSGSIIGLHQYGHPGLPDDAEWHALRHRKLLDRLAALGYPRQQVILGEYGYDKAGAGWHGNIEWPEYLRQLAWADQRLQQDLDVICATIYTSGATQQWASFDLGEAESRDLSAYIQANGTIVEQPPVIVKPTITELITEWVTRRDALLTAYNRQQVVEWAKLNTALAAVDREMQGRME